MTKPYDIKKVFLRNKLKLAIYLVLTPLSTVLSILFTLSLEPIISAAMLADGTRLVRAALASLVVAGLDMVIALLSYRIQLQLTQSCADSLRCDLMEGILRQPVSSFSGRDVTGYISLFNNDINRLKDIYFSSVFNIYQGLWSFILSMAALLYFSPWMGIFLFAVGLVSINLPSLFAKTLHRKQEEQMKKAEQHISLLHDIFCGYWIIKNHVAEWFFGDQYHRMSVKLAQADFQGEYYPYKTSWLSTCITTLAFVGVISISAYSVIRGAVAASAILSLSQLMGGVLVPLEAIPRDVSELKGARCVAEKLSPYLVDGSASGSAAADPWKDDWNTIAVSQIHFAYDESASAVIRNASLQIERGKKYVIIGRSGSGKSTLAKILAGICPARFSLTVDGRSADPSALFPHVSYMDQHAFLFHDTIYQNISLSREISREKVREMLDKMQFAKAAAPGENILNVSVGEGGAKLSGGEKQRIALARELIVRKDILILDEYTSSLDPETAKALDELVLGLSGVTCLLITHQLDSLLLKRCDAVYSLEEGKLVEL